MGNLNAVIEHERSRSSSGDKPERSSLGDLGARLKYVRGNRARDDWAAELGIGRSTLQRYENDERPPDADLLQRICIKEQINPTWLLLGIGEPKAVLLQKMPTTEDRAAELDDDEFALIKGYDVQAGAGHGRVIESEQVIGRFAFRREWLRRRRLDPKHLAIITAHGDSMEPTIAGGEAVMVDTSPLQRIEDGIYVLQLSGHLIVKRLQILPPDQVTVISDNPMYQPYTLSLNALSDREQTEYHLVGRVVWAAKEFL